jgi:hypothetical protein
MYAKDNAELVWKVISKLAEMGIAKGIGKGIGQGGREDLGAGL